MDKELSEKDRLWLEKMYADFVNDTELRKTIGVSVYSLACLLRGALYDEINAAIASMARRAAEQGQAAGIIFQAKAEAVNFDDAPDLGCIG